MLNAVKHLCLKNDKHFYCVTLSAAKSLCPNHFTFEKAQSINFPFCFAERYFYNLPPNSLFPPQEEKLERKLCVLSKGMRSFARCRALEDDYPAVTLSEVKSLCVKNKPAEKPRSFAKAAQDRRERRVTLSGAKSLRLNNLPLFL